MLITISCRVLYNLLFWNVSSHQFSKYFKLKRNQTCHPVVHQREEASSQLEILVRCTFCSVEMRFFCMYYTASHLYTRSYRRSSWDLSRLSHRQRCWRILEGEGSTWYKYSVITSNARNNAQNGNRKMLRYVGSTWNS